MVGILTDLEPFFASQAQEVFVPGTRVFDLQTRREGVYITHIAGWGDLAFVTFDGDHEATEVSFSDIRNLHR